MNLIILKPNKENLQTYLVLGVMLLSIGFFDIISNTFLNFNMTRFLPSVTYVKRFFLLGFNISKFIFLFFFNSNALVIPIHK